MDVPVDSTEETDLAAQVCGGRSDDMLEGDTQLMEVWVEHPPSILSCLHHSRQPRPRLYAASGRGRRRHTANPAPVKFVSYAASPGPLH